MLPPPPPPPPPPPQKKKKKKMRMLNIRPIENFVVSVSRLSQLIRFQLKQAAFLWSVILISLIITEVTISIHKRAGQFQTHCLHGLLATRSIAEQKNEGTIYNTSTRKKKSPEMTHPANAIREKEYERIKLSSLQLSVKLKPNST